MRRSLSLLALTLAVAASAPAWADPAPEEQAAALKKQGDAAMDALRYDEAIDDYTKAYAIHPDPALLYNRGRVHQARGEMPAALADLEKFARDASPDLRARVPRLDELLADVRSHVATLQVTSNATGARVLVRNVQVATTPVSAPLQLDAGPAHVEVLAEGYVDWRKDLDLKGGTTTVLDAQLAQRSTQGVLRVHADTPGTRVLLDGAPVGAAPAEAVVAAGEHRVAVQAAGHDDRFTTVVLAAGETKDVDLEPAARPGLLGRWWFWTAVGVAVAGGAVATYALLTEKAPGTGDRFQPGQVAGPLVSW